MKDLRDIVHELNHTGRHIDVFKIDCEGCEWETQKSWFEAPVTLGEVLVEVHSGTKDPTENPRAKQFMQAMQKS